MRIGRGLIVLLVVAFSASSAMAGGFRLPEAGAKAMGMGFAFTAQADDPSAIYFNPAGIMQLEGVNIMTGGTIVDAAGGTFSGITPLTLGVPRGESQKDLIFLIPNAYFTHRVSPKFAWGVGFFSPFGTGQKYQELPLSIFRNQVREIDLQTVVINPTVAYKVNQYLSVGGGIDFMYGKAKLKNSAVLFTGAAPPFGPFYDLYKVSLKGDGTAWAFNLGALVSPTKELKIGLSYRSPFTLKINKGDMFLTEIDNLLPLAPLGGATAAAYFGGGTPVSVVHNKGTTYINLPATAAVGVSYTIDKLTLEVDADFAFWSSYKRLDIDILTNNALLPDSLKLKNYRDTVAFYIGGEYRVTKPLALRLGFRYDPTPVPAPTMGPELPDALKLSYCAGLGYKYSNWTFDLAYMYVDKRDRVVNNLGLMDPVISATGRPGSGFNGKWSGEAHLVAMDIGYKF